MPASHAAQRPFSGHRAASGLTDSRLDPPARSVHETRRATLNQIVLKPSAVAGALGAAAFFLVLVSTFGQLVKFVAGYDEVHGLLSLTFVDGERNVPALFSVFLLAIAALCSTIIAVLAKKHKYSDVSRWAILSFGFLYLALDEGLSLHERLSKPVRELLGSGTLGFTHSFWTIPGIAGLLVLAVFLLPFLWRLPARTRFTLCGAAALFVGGAVGFELIGGDYAELHGDNNLTYSMIATVEESLEMAGVIVGIYGLLNYIALNYKQVRLRFDDPAENWR